MTPAERLTAQLGGEWRSGSGSARCPAHLDNRPSLSIRDGDNEGCVLVFCFAGCSSDRVIAALCALGYWQGDRHATDPADEAEGQRRACERETEEAKRRSAALKLWREAVPAMGSPVESYLRSRAITLAPPPTLRYLAAAKHTPTGLIFGAMVAAIATPDRKISAVHRTFLNAEGTAKASVRDPKLALGRIGPCSVHLGRAASALAICEGIETGLSFMQMTGISTWCACGSWLERVAVPPVVERIIVAADRGEAGERAAEKAAGVHREAGRLVEVRFPAVGIKDWNDQLRAATNGTGQAA